MRGLGQSGKRTVAGPSGERLEIQSRELERVRTEGLLRLQRDLAVELGKSTNLWDTLGRILEVVCRIEGIDSGGVYLVDKDSGSIDLVRHVGLPQRFVESSRHYDTNSSQARLVFEGKPVYGLYSEVATEVNDIRREEGLRAIAVIPVRDESRVVAVLNLASHTHDDFSFSARHALEAIAAQIGGVIARVGAEQALRERERDLQGLFDTLEDFLFVLDSTGRIIHANEFVRRRLGYSTEELSSLHVEALHPPERRAEAREIFSAIVEGKASHCTIPLLGKDGSLIPVDTKAVQGRWKGENVLIGVCRDVTALEKAEQELSEYRRRLEALVEERTEELAKVNEQLRQEIEHRKMTEESLRQSEEKFRETAEMLPSMICEIDLNRCITYLNRNGMETLGISQDDIDAGVFLYDVLHPEDQAKTIQGIELMSREGGIQSEEVRFRTKDGFLHRHNRHLCTDLEWWRANWSARQLDRHYRAKETAATPQESTRNGGHHYFGWWNRP